jgi:hypothetical protein
MGSRTDPFHSGYEDIATWLDTVVHMMAHFMGLLAMIGDQILRRMKMAAFIYRLPAVNGLEMMVQHPCIPLAGGVSLRY